MIYNRVFGILALVYFVLPSVARADVILEFGQGGNIGLTSFSAVEGTSVNIDIYITQRAPATQLTSPGIWTMGFRFEIDGSGGLTHFTNLQGIPSYFDEVRENKILPDSGGLILRVDAIRKGETPPGLTTGEGNSIYLGTATLSANAVGAYNLDIRRTNDLSFTLGGSIAPLLVLGNSATFTVTAVPEPGSLLSIGLCTMIGGLARIRFRKKASSF